MGITCCLSGYIYSVLRRDSLGKVIGNKESNWTRYQYNRYGYVIYQLDYEFN